MVEDEVTWIHGPTFPSSEVIRGSHHFILTLQIEERAHKQGRWPHLLVGGLLDNLTMASRGHFHSTDLGCHLEEHVAPIGQWMGLTDLLPMSIQVGWHSTDYLHVSHVVDDPKRPSKGSWEVGLSKGGGGEAHRSLTWQWSSLSSTPLTLIGPHLRVDAS